jgi:hypothetical protein
MGQHESKAVSSMHGSGRCCVCGERFSEAVSLRHPSGISLRVCDRCLGRGHAEFSSRQKINERFCEIVLDNASCQCENSDIERENEMRQMLSEEVGRKIANDSHNGIPAFECPLCSAYMFEPGKRVPHAARLVALHNRAMRHMVKGCANDESCR